MKCIALCLAVSGWLTSHGFGVPQRDAVLQNMYLESRFTPCITRGPRGSAYLLQWLGPRRRALEAYVGGLHCPAWPAQMEFMKMELSGTKYARFWAARDAGVAFHEMRERFGRGR